MTQPDTTAIAPVTLRGVAAELWAFVRRPALPADGGERGLTRANILGVVWLYAITALAALVILGIIGPLMAIDGAPEPTELLKLLNMPLNHVLLLIVVAAPLGEEIIFRSWISGIVHRPPKWYRALFPMIYFAQAIGFGAIHMFNYDGGSGGPALLTLLFVLPQLIAGLIWGYARVRYGWWANIALHMAHNAGILALTLIPMAVSGNLPSV
jgi:membrane protease YdiL (CAAX protease family)